MICLFRSLHSSDERAKKETIFEEKPFCLSSFVRHAISTFEIVPLLNVSSNDLAVTDSPRVSIRAVHLRLLSQSRFRSFSLSLSLSPFKLLVYFFAFALYLWPLKNIWAYENYKIELWIKSALDKHLSYEHNNNNNNKIKNLEYFICVCVCVYVCVEDVKYFYIMQEIYYLFPDKLI